MESTLKAQDIMLEVKKFVGNGRTSVVSSSYEVTQASLNLLKNVPAVRESVLEHFCSVFSVAITKYLRQLEARSQVIVEEPIINEIHMVLSNFVKRNAEAWSPIVLDWSLNLLGNLSSDYSRCTINGDIHSSIQYWLSCQATRTLIDLTALCLQNQMYSNAESCINTLFNISALHNPHFDWVVAHVGGCFPDIIIIRILSNGLQDYCGLMTAEYKDKRKEGKLHSLIGILSHLSGSHSPVIKNAVLNLFMASIRENITDTNEKARAVATVPFLLNLASHFPLVLNVLTSDILKILKPDLIPQLALYSTDWKKYFNNDTIYLLNTAIKLTLACNQEAFQIINILLDTSLDNKNAAISQYVKDVCIEIIELILKEAEYIIRTDYVKTIDVPLIVSIKQDLPNIMSLLMDHHPLQVKTAMRLLSLLGAKNFNILVLTATYVLQKARTNVQLALLIRFVIDNTIYAAKKYKNDNITSNIGYFTQVVEQSMKEVQYSNSIDDSAVCQLFKNLTTLLKWENSGKVPCLEHNYISQAVKVNLLQMIMFLNNTHNFSLASNIVEMLCLLNLTDNGYLSNVELILKLTKSVIHYFDMCIAESDIIKKQRGSKMVCDFLRGLMKYSQFARVLALREILEVTIFCEQAKYYGSREKCKFNVLEELLMQQNHKQGSGAILAQRHSSVFHAGVIGQGPRKLIINNGLDVEIIQLNNTLLMDLIKACCSSSNFDQYPVNIDSINLVSLLLVELISPDVMYNGLPWPDEEFTKVTVERDLQIRRSFEDAPVLWTLLQLTAWYRPALAYCSVLLRAIIATILANCNTYKGTKIANVMSLGQLLPPPITTIINILPVLKPCQIIMILRECVWMYIHENIPSPMLFTRNESFIAWRDTDTSTPNKRFTETLRLLVLSNIHTLGSLYAALFV